MKRNRKKESFISIIILLTVIIAALFLFSRTGENPSGQFSCLDDMNGHVFAVEQGAIFGDEILRYYEYAGSQSIDYYHSNADAIGALKSKKADIVVADLPIMEAAAANNHDLMVFPEFFVQDQYGFGFQKGSPLRDSFNDAMKKLKAEGLDQEMHDKWISAGGASRKVIEQDWDAPNGTLQYWVNASGEPMSFPGENGQLKGYSIDYVLHVAKEMGYRVEVTECNFDGMIPAVMSGKADLCGAAFSITEERKESLDFSDVFYEGAVAAVIRKEMASPEIPAAAGGQDVKNSESFFGGIASSFRRTFIEESRWTIFASGLLRTIGITAFTIIFGTLLGFVFYFLLRKTSPAICGGFEKLFGIILGIPTVVLVMVFFYIIFGKSEISGFTVSIIAFSLTLGISVYSMIRHGINTLSPTQAEGAYALGLSENETLLYVLMPQAIRNVISLYSDELVSLVKATAIVGYIAVQDLTKASDLIRAKTFDAFYPLIFTAVIYYLLERLLVFLIRRIEKKIDPFTRSKSRILKGVQDDSN